MTSSAHCESPVPELMRKPRYGEDGPQWWVTEIRRVLNVRRFADYDTLRVDCLSLDEAAAMKALLTDEECAKVTFTWIFR